MCGIVGISRGSERLPVGLDAVEKMAASITHRGPDDLGFHVAENEQAILGMRRLSIIDLAGGHQPISNEDESVWVVCNGEIYNFGALRTRLEAQGHRFRTHSDVEVLAHLYEEYGDAFVEHASGMFGVALWDARRRRLVLARDRFGQKPLYFVETRGSLAFASEVKALLELPFVRAEVDPTALREYLAMGYATAPRTMFRNIRKLPPAHRLIWERGVARIERYWSLPDQVRSDLDESQWVELIRAELRRAVTEHMVSDVPIGAFLSGGIDSSAVVALMAESSDRPVKTYSIGYASAGVAQHYNELSYANAVAQRFRTEHHEIPVNPNVAALLPKLLWHLEEPISDSAILTTWLVSELAAQSVKVILSGVGGDELFGGYTRYLGDHFLGRYQRVPGWLRRSVAKPLAKMLPSGRHNRLMDLSRYAKKFLSTSEMPWRQRYRQYVEICGGGQLAALCLADGLVADGFTGVLQEETAEDALLRIMRVDARTQLPEDLLLLTDKVTMATSLECRVPFLDHKLAEAAAQIPAAIKMRGGELKYLLRRALTGIVPDAVLRRGKRGFGAPVGSWFKSELRVLRNALLSRPVVEARGLVSWEAVRDVLDAHDSSREDFSDLILVLVNLEIWCRLFLDRARDGEVAAELQELAVAA
jgi:asparagine synthase (glutamine-hydrolysing)